MAQTQKPDPKNMVKVGRLKQIVEGLKKENYDIEATRKAFGESEGGPISDAAYIDDQKKLAANQDKINRYGSLISKANKEATEKAKNMVPVKRLNQIADSLINQAAKKIKTRAGLGGNMKKEYSKDIMKSADADLTTGLRYKGLINKTLNKK